MLYIFRFRVFTRTMQIGPERAQKVVLAACVLHNILRTIYSQDTNMLVDREDGPGHDVLPGQWRQEVVLTRLHAMQGNNSTNAGKAVRDYLKDYFQTTEGQVRWQDRQSRKNY